MVALNDMLASAAKTLPATKGYEIVVSAVDFERLAHFKWYAFTRPNRPPLPARREGTASRRVIFLVNEIMPPKQGMVVDHINGNPWDNRRENLRYCTNAQNSRNRRKVGGASRFKGVRKHRNSFQAQITFQRRHIHLGSNETDAALAYDEAARNLFGQFAALNFPNLGEQSALRGAQ